MSVPHLTKQNGKTILMVHDKPFLMLAGELHNSNSSTAQAMDASCKKAVELGMNSVIATLSWEMIEPQEGKFDFSTVDMVVGKAREYGLKLELIWFGSWKNAQCYYAPAWVKQDTKRFFRAELEKGQNYFTFDNGGTYTSISYLCDAACEADAQAFGAVMAHIKEIDGKENTVLMMQVENETGLQGSGRERSELADSVFAGQVPQDLVDYLKAHTEHMARNVKAAVESGASSGTWEECFGEVAEEVFSAYHVSSYVNRVAATGKAVYDLPMSANCWLVQRGKPGDYPSGGPVYRMMEVWQHCAPAIDIIAPDIYVPYFCDVCDKYVKNGNPLFIPETAVHSYAAVRELYCVGHHHAVCYAPFGFEDMGQPFTAMQSFLFGVDVTDPALKTPQDPEKYRKVNQLLSSMRERLTAKYGTDDLQAVISERPEQDTVEMGQFGFKFIMKNPFTGESSGAAGALVLKDDGYYYLLMDNCGVIPFSADPQKPHFDFLDVEEGCFENGKWVTHLRRNGDEVAFIAVTEPTLIRMRLLAQQ